RRRWPTGCRQQLRQLRILIWICRRVALEYDRRGVVIVGVMRLLADLRQISFALVIIEPGNLKRAVAFDQSTLIVVNRLARAREQSCSGVVVAEDQLRIGFAGLQRDAPGHLTDRAARQA